MQMPVMPLYPSSPSPAAALTLAHGRRQPGEQPTQPRLLRPGALLNRAVLQLGQQLGIAAVWQAEWQRQLGGLRQQGCSVALPESAASASQGVKLRHCLRAGRGAQGLRNEPVRKEGEVDFYAW